MEKAFRTLGTVQAGGARLAGLLLSIAVGGTWPRSRKGTLPEHRGKSESELQDFMTCLRCKGAVETSFHRSWACSCNKDSPICEASDT
eukprot:5663187-Pyramimonas_sp.AAC.1